MWITISRKWQCAHINCGYCSGHPWQKTRLMRYHTCFNTTVLWTPLFLLPSTKTAEHMRPLFLVFGAMSLNRGSTVESTMDLMSNTYVMIMGNCHSSCTQINIHFTSFTHQKLKCYLCGKLECSFDISLKTYITIHNEVYHINVFKVKVM